MVLLGFSATSQLVREISEEVTVAPDSSRRIRLNQQSTIRSHDKIRASSEWVLTPARPQSHPEIPRRIHPR